MCHTLTPAQRSAYLRLQEMMHAYLIARDADAMLAYFTDDVQSIGSGAQTVVFGRDALHRLAASEIARNPLPVSALTFEQVSATGSAGEEQISLCAVASVSKQRPSGIPIHLRLRLTAQLRRVDGLFYISMIHVSIPADPQIERADDPIQFVVQPLREQHARLEHDLFVLLNETMSGGIFGSYCTPGAPLCFINTHMLTFLGYDSCAQFEAATGGLVQNAVHPDDRSRFRELLTRARAGQQQEPATYRMLTRSGGAVWVHDKRQLICTGDGRSVSVSVCFDLTTTVETETELTLIAQSKIGGIFKARLTDGFPLLYANDCYFQLHGHTRESFAAYCSGQTEKIVHPDDIEAVSAQIAQAIQNREESLTLEYRVLRGDGKTAWLHASAALTQTSSGFQLSGMVINIDARKRSEEELQRSEERFQIAIAQAQIYVWEYDLATHTILQTNQSPRPHTPNHTIPNVPDSLLDSQAVHPDDADKCRALFDKLHSGTRSASTILRMRDPDGSYRWRRIHYTNLFDGQGTPARAIAVSSDVTEQMETEQRFFQAEYLREMCSDDVLASAKVNLTQGAVLHIWNQQEHGLDLHQLNRYDDLHAEIMRCIATPGDQKRFDETFSQQALLTAAQSGRNVSHEFRCILHDGRIIWCAFHVDIRSDPDTAELLAFAHIRNINDRKKAELALRERAERDSLTGLYNRQTIESLIGQRLTDLREQEGQCACLILDLDDFKYINDHYGHYHGDRLLSEVGRILRVHMTGDCIAARLGGDEFMMFFNEAPSLQWAHDTAQDLCRQLRIQYTIGNDILNVSASVGIVTSDLHSADFTRLFQQADSALYEAKHHGKARAACYGSQIPEQVQEMHRLYDGCLAKQHIGKHCMLDELDDAIFVIDEENHDVLFMNRTAQQEFGVESYQGRKCYDVLQGFSRPCIFCHAHLPDDTGGFRAWENVNARLHKRFLIRDRIMHWDGHPARLEIFTDLTRHEEQLNANIQAEHVLLECVSLLTGAAGLDTALPGVLRMLGRFYRADRVYLVHTPDAHAIQISEHDWRAPGVPALTDENLRVERSSTAAFLDCLCTERVVVYPELAQMCEIFPEKYAILQEKGASTFAAVALLDDHNGLLGYIGIENLRSNPDSTTLLQSLSYVLHSQISRQQSELRNTFLTEHDALTGLLNWQSYCRFEQNLHPEALSSLGVLAADLNHLRLLNQTRGINYGDRLLCALAHALTAAFGASACFRLSGDCLAALCTDTTYETFQSRLEQVRAEMERTYPGCVSFGHAWTDTDILPASLMDYALERLSATRNKPQMHCPPPSSHVRDAHLHRLQASLADGRFQVYLQPKAAIKSGRIVGAEALVRYTDEIHGLVPPVKFIGRLEAENTIQYVDFFVLEQVCSLLQTWAAQGAHLFPISVNFSRCTLMEADVVDKLIRMTDRYGVERSLLEIEITESMGEIDHHTLASVCRQIIAAGYRLSLDDFGAEYSNFSILSSLPIKGLKFDKRVINDLYANPTTRLLIENLIHVCQQMGIDSVAEGVEEPEQLAILRTLGCTYAQGYLFNKPLPIPDFERHYLDLSAGRPVPAP